MISRFILAAAFAGPASLAAAADGVIYTCVDAKGHRTYTNAPCPSGTEAKAAKVYDDPGWNPQVAALAGLRPGRPIPRSVDVARPVPTVRPCFRQPASSAPMTC